MTLTDKDIIDFMIASLISLLTISWCFLVFAWFKPEKAAYFAAMFSQTKSMRQKLRPVETAISAERIIYKNHIVYGLVIVALSLYILFNLNKGLEAQLMVDFIDNKKFVVITEIVSEALVLVMWIGSAFSLLIGTILVARPGLLKKLEAKSNYWFSTRNAMKGLEKEHTKLDSYFAKNTKKMVLPLLVACTVLIGVLLYTATIIRI